MSLPQQSANVPETVDQHSAKQPKFALGETVPENAWRKFHKVTPVAAAGGMWAGLLTAIIVILMDFLENVEDGITGLRMLAKTITGSDTTPMIILIVLGALILLTILVLITAWFMWQNKTYAVVDSGVHLRWGVFFKKHQHTRWDRIQSVEIQQPFLGRIFGFGTVKVESAGVGEEKTELGLLKLDDCGYLRREILNGLARSRAGLDPTSYDDENATPDAALLPGDVAVVAGAGVATSIPAVPDNPVNDIPLLDPDDLENDQLIFKLVTKRLALGKLLNLSVLIGIPLLVAYSYIIFRSGAGSLAVIIFIIPLFFNTIKSLFDEWGTRVFLSENGLRVRSGLTQLITTTLPPSRIHAVHIRQPMLWRRFDWWQLKVTLAGQETGAGDELTRSMIIPVGTREEIYRVLWTIMPSLGTDDDAAMLAEALDGYGTGRFFRGAPTTARPLDPIVWKSRGLCLTPTVYATRSGRFSRQVGLVLQDRIQSAELSEGPLQRFFGLASIDMHTVSGILSVGQYRAKNFARYEAEHAFWQQNELTKKARDVGVTEDIDVWKARVGVA